MFDVISIGAATVDIIAKSESLLVNNNLLSLSYSSKNEISDGLICSGGGATNSSSSFSNLGLRSACVAIVGNDPISSYVFNDLQKYHIDNYFLTQKIEQTDYSIILVAPDGGRSILTNRGDSRLEENNIDWDRLKETKWFYITSLEGNIDLLEKIIGFANEFNIKVSLNPGNRELKQKSQLSPLLKFVDFLLLNETEAEEFMEMKIDDNPDFWKKLSECGAKIIAVTKGRDGAHVLYNGENYFSPILNVQPVCELGAGDAFGSAFVAGLIYGLQPKDALFWGIKNSASVVSKLGAKSGLLTLEEIKQS